MGEELFADGVGDADAVNPHSTSVVQLLHSDEPGTLNCPGPHANCVGDVDAAPHTYPALQFAHDALPDSEYCPGPHADCVGVVDPTPHT